MNRGQYAYPRRRRQRNGFRGGGEWRNRPNSQTGNNNRMNNNSEYESISCNNEFNQLSDNWDNVETQPTFRRVQTNYYNRGSKYKKYNKNEVLYKNNMYMDKNSNESRSYDGYDGESDNSSSSQQNRKFAEFKREDNYDKPMKKPELHNNLTPHDEDKVTLIRNMSTNLKNILQEVNPGDIVKQYRQEINGMSESCLSKHEKNFEKVALCIQSSDNRKKKVWDEHLSNLKQQQKTFDKFIANIKSDLADIYGLPANTVINKCDEIKASVLKECKIFKRSLPIYSVKEKIISSVQNNAVTIISADAGYYASAVIPLFLQDVFSDGVIISCQPNAAMCVSLYYNCTAFTHSYCASPTLVAYEINNRGSIKSEDTKILFIPVQELISLSLDDPNFTPYSCIIFHCALRRTIESDFLLEALRKCVTSRKNFKVIVILSAHEDVTKFENYFSVSTCVETLVLPSLILPVGVVWKKGPPCDDYIDEVVMTALAIHALEDPGDVLIFLPTVRDLKKVRAILTKKLYDHNYDNAECVCIYEHLEDQQILNFNQFVSKKRNFVITTSWAEQLVFPRVSFVIDSGLTKDCSYDPVKCLELKTVSFISQTRSKLRKDCAGRMNSGKCYRLYNKHNYANEMVLHELPDILKKNPFDIMVKMFQYKPENTMEVEFVESISNDSKENALEMLTKANAIKDGQLTTLGQRIVKLPFLPKYSKLIILGIEWGYAFEAILLVALYLVKKPVFLQSNNKEQQKKIEVNKLQFLVCDSDTLTFINVYRFWMDNNFDETWCKEHCLSLELLQKVQSNVEEILSIVSERLKEEIVTEVHSEGDMDYKVLQEMIFDCFKDNLCLYSGHHRSGYCLPKAKCMTFLHPASPVLQKKDLPQFVVFSDLHAAVRNYMMNVTAIPEDVVVSEAECGTLHLKPSELYQHKLESFVIEPVGIMLIKNTLLGKEGRKLHKIEEKIKFETKSDLIVIEPSEEKGLVTVFTLPQCKKEAETIMRNVLKEKIDDLLHEEEMRTLELKKGQHKVLVNVTWVKGASVVDLKTNCDNISVETKLKEKDSLLPQEKASVVYSINLTWPRRLCKGLGFLTFSSDDFSHARRLSLKTVNIRGSEADIQINKNFPNQLFISNLNAETTDDDLKQAIENLMPQVTVVKSSIVYQKPFVTTDSDIQKIKEMLEGACYELTGTNDFIVDVTKPKDFHTKMIANITMRNSTAIENGANFFNDFMFDRVAVKAKPVYSSTIFCSIHVYQAIREELCEKLQLLFDEFSKKHFLTDVGRSFQFYDELQDDNSVCLKLTAHKLEIMNALHRTIQKFLEGMIVTCDMIKGLHKLFTHGGHLWLTSLENQENVHVMEEYKTKILRLYGSTSACHNAVKRIQEFMIDVENETVSVIDLPRGKNVRALLKVVIQNYGFDLKDFIKEFKLRSAEMDVRAQKLILHGSYDSIEKAVGAVEQLAEKCFSDVDELLSSQEACVLCGMPPLQMSIRLEHCGHLYCIECVRGLVANAEFPVLCCADACDKELILEDVRKVLNYDEGEISELLNRSVTAYISKNSEKLAYCPAPDCSMFFNKTEVSRDKWNCPLCQNDICIKCNVIFHHGYTCEMYQGSKNDPNFSFKVWLKENNPNCKQCPKCNTGIEKTEGCNHMTCHNCRAHFCWLCCKAFPTGRMVYNHQPYCPAR